MSRTDKLNPAPRRRSLLLAIAPALSLSLYDVSACRASESTPLHSTLNATAGDAAALTQMFGPNATPYEFKLRVATQSFPSTTSAWFGPAPRDASAALVSA